MIKIIQSLREDGAILQSVEFPLDLKTANLDSRERLELALAFIDAGQNLLRNIPTEVA